MAVVQKAPCPFVEFSLAGCFDQFDCWEYLPASVIAALMGVSSACFSCSVLSLLHKELYSSVSWTFHRLSAVVVGSRWTSVVNVFWFLLVAVVGGFSLP
jgi:hypothetical protein